MTKNIKERKDTKPIKKYSDSVIKMSYKDLKKMMITKDIKEYSASVISVSYDDIKSAIEEKKLMSKKEEQKYLKRLNEGDIDYISKKVGDSIMETYWVALEEVIKTYYP